MFNAATELRLISRQMRSLLSFQAQQETLMSDTTQALSDLAAAVDGVVARVDEDVNSLLAKIAALEAASDAEKAELVAAAEGIRSQVTRLSEIDPVPSPAPTPEPPAEPQPEPPAPEPVPGT